jgi:uncharacterized protein YkwD
MLARAAILIALLLAAASLSGPGRATAGATCQADPSIDTEEQELVRLINDYRVSNGRTALALSDSLSRAAAWKSRHMAGNDYFGHDDLGLNRDFIERLRDCGYTYNTWLGETLAAGNAGARATFDQWRNSPSHNETLLSTNYTAIGVGRAYDAGSTYGWYWTAEFGGQVESPPPGSTPGGSGDASCDGSTNSMDAVLILQRAAGSLASLPCPSEADVNGNGRVDATDAALVLQFEAGLLARLPL